MHFLHLFIFNINIYPSIFIVRVSFSPCSHGEATRGAEAAARKAMSDQRGAAEAKQGPG